MKKILVAIMFGIMAIAAHAEASFDQIQGLIEQRQYQAAEQGLEVIIKNHPQSAKAFYAMAQAQAGLGNLEKAQKALNIATGLNPTLDFAPASSVASLKQAITPQVSKIEAVEETHTLRNTILVMFVLAMGFVVYSVYRRNKETEEKYAEKERAHDEAMEQVRAKMAAEREKDRKAASEFAAGYVPPAKPAFRGTTTRVTPTPAPAPTPAPSAPTHTTVVNNNSSSNDLLTGVLIGDMLSHHHSHDTTRVVEREVIRETPKRDSSWEDTPAPSRSSRSSSWDDDSSSSSSKKSSSWDDSSSSSSSSSWSSSSDSSSSSSWDSGSSSSGSSDW